MRIWTYCAKVTSRPWALLLFLSMISSIRSVSSCFHNSDASSGTSKASISSIELILPETELVSMSLAFFFPVTTHLQFVLSLKSPSSSSDACREPAWDVVREFAAEEARDDRDFAFLETVLWLSRAWRRRSCILLASSTRCKCAEQVEHSRRH